MPYLRIITPSYPPDLPQAECQRRSEEFLQAIREWDGLQDLTIIAGTPFDVQEVQISPTCPLFVFAVAPSGVPLT